MDGGEGVLYIGRAQEKARVLRTERRHDPRTGAAYPWLVESTAFVNHYYVYAVDDDFGPFFLKFCSYFPYNAKLCINGHEYLKRQLTKRGIAFEALDNGILRCADPVRMQRLADGVDGGAGRCAASQVAGAAAAFVRGPRPATGHPLRTSRFCRRSSLGPRYSTARRRGGSSSKRCCARTSTWVAPTPCS